jgi:hypothetical protein
MSPTPYSPRSALNRINDSSGMPTRIIEGGKAQQIHHVTIPHDDAKAAIDDGDALIQIVERVEYKGCYIHVRERAGSGLYTAQGFGVMFSL